MGDFGVHLDPSYQRDHGRPIGRWDLKVERTETNRRLDSIDGELKNIRTLDSEQTHQ